MTTYYKAVAADGMSYNGSPRVSYDPNAPGAVRASMQSTVASAHEVAREVVLAAPGIVADLALPPHTAVLIAGADELVIGSWGYDGYSYAESEGQIDPIDVEMFGARDITAEGGYLTAAEMIAHGVRWAGAHSG